MNETLGNFQVMDFAFLAIEKISWWPLVVKHINISFYLIEAEKAQAYFQFQPWHVPHI